MSWINLLSIVYPIGSIYMSFSNISPASIVGGTWSKIENRFLYCSNDTTTGGENEHTLTIEEIPSHQHGNSANWKWECSTGFTTGIYHIQSINGGNATTATDYYTGGSQPFNNMPAYQSIYCWRRTA